MITLTPHDITHSSKVRIVMLTSSKFTLAGPTAAPIYWPPCDQWKIMIMH